MAIPTNPTFMLKNLHYDLIIPDGVSEAEALSRTTHLAIGAHQDDLEIMAYHGIACCYDDDKRWFTGVTATDGASSSRIGPYSDFSNEEMVAQRKKEQRDAATIGRYSAQYQLGYSSADVKNNPQGGLVDDLKRLISAARPTSLYLHNPADKHDTHVALLVACIEAIKALPAEDRPERILGCEVWRDLDWVPDEKKSALDVSPYPDLAEKLLNVFDSQISGGKRYDLATLGRRCANATFSAPRESDSSQAITFALDLHPLLKEDGPSIADFTSSLIAEFQTETEKRINQFNRSCK